MMRIVYRYIDNEMSEHVGIAPLKAFEVSRKTMRQLIEVCGWRCNEEQRYRLMEMENEELCEILNAILQDVLHVEHPN